MKYKPGVKRGGTKIKTNFELIFGVLLSETDITRFKTIK